MHFAKGNIGNLGWIKELSKRYSTRVGLWERGAGILALVLSVVFFWGTTQVVEEGEYIYTAKTLLDGLCVVYIAGTIVYTALLAAGFKNIIIGWTAVCSFTALVFAVVPLMTSIERTVWSSISELVSTPALAGSLILILLTLVLPEE